VNWDTVMNDFVIGDLGVVGVAGRAVEPTTITRDQFLGIVFEVLEDNVLCSIATVTPEGTAHVNTAFFVYSNALELFSLASRLSALPQSGEQSIRRAHSLFLGAAVDAAGTGNPAVRYCRGSVGFGSRKGGTVVWSLVSGLPHLEGLAVGG
jgi:hypothetical protein